MTTTSRLARLIGLTILLLSGVGARVAVAAWGVGPTLFLFLVPVAWPLVTLAVRLIAAKGRSRTDDLWAGARLALFAAIAMAVGYVIALAVTYQPFELQTGDSKGRTVAYPASEYEYDVTFWSASACKEMLQIWGHRRFTVGDVQHHEVVTWQGSPRRLDEISAPESFGLTTMSSPDTGMRRSARDGFCLGGEPVAWGLDNSPDGEHRDTVWFQKDGKWISEKAPGPVMIYNVLQDDPDGVVVVLRHGDNGAATLKCKAVPPDAEPRSVLDDLGARSWASLPEGETLLDAATRGGDVVALVGPADAENNYEISELGVIVSEGCDEPHTTYRLQVPQSEGDARLYSPRIVAGPGNYTAIVDLRSLEIFEFEREELSRVFEFDVGYDVQSSGIYGIYPADDGVLRILLWAYPWELPEGWNIENQMHELEWAPKPRLCLRLTGHCFDLADAVS